MIEDNDEQQSIKEFIKARKPRLFLPIWTTVICSGPPLNLYIDLFLTDPPRYTQAEIIMSIFGISWLTLIWYWYIREKKKFKKLKILIPKVIHYYYLQDESSLKRDLKNISEIIGSKSTKKVLAIVEEISDHIDS
jgi:hypothetical protein